MHKFEEMIGKIFKLRAEEISELIPKQGGCFATDKITVNGIEVGYILD